MKRRYTLSLPCLYLAISGAALLASPGSGASTTYEFASMLDGVVILISMPLGLLGVLFADASGNYLGFAFVLLIAGGALQYLLIGLAIDLYRSQRQRKRKRRPTVSTHADICRHCGYALVGNTSGKCPECGNPYRFRTATLEDGPRSYLVVEWEHADENEPIRIYSELDANRNEIRKVELFRDGCATHADAFNAQGTTQLSHVPWPTLEEIARDPQFRPRSSSKTEFESAWAHAVASIDSTP